MRIAVYLPGIKPEAGGSSSLLKTIQQEILAASDLKDEYVFLINILPSIQEIMMT